MFIENFTSQTKTFSDILQYIFVMFVVGLLDAYGIVVDMFKVHDLLVKHLNLAKISRIPRSRMCLGQDQLWWPGDCMTFVNMFVCCSGINLATQTLLDRCRPLLIKVSSPVNTLG